MSDKFEKAEPRIEYDIREFSGGLDFTPNRSQIYRVELACFECDYTLGKLLIHAGSSLEARQKYIASTLSRKEKEKKWLRHPASHKRNNVCEARDD
jgi:hypothetical protein